jgi:H+-transporting ATPase
MLWTAATIEHSLGNYVGMGILLGIQFITAAFSFYETSKAGDAVAALKASLKPLATVKRDGRWQNVDATRLVPGDLVKLAAGSAVPADCYVNEGEIEVDQSATTGESLPVKLHHGDLCKMGSTVTRGESDGTVQATGQNTILGKTATMLQSVENVGGSMPTSLSGMMKVLVFLPLSLCMTSFIFLIVDGNNRSDDMLKKDSAETVKVSFSCRPGAFSFPFKHQVTCRMTLQDALAFAGAMLLASIPFAVQPVTTATLAAGVRTLAPHGAIVARPAALEELAGALGLKTDVAWANDSFSSKQLCVCEREREPRAV